MHEILHDTALFELRAPSVSSWSCGEQAGHVLLAADAMAAAIEANLADPERNRDGTWADYTLRVLEQGRFPRGRARAPRRLDPAGRSREELVALAPDVAARWEAIGARRRDVSACPARGEHFAFGWLTSAEWVRACSIHTAHHLAIVRDIGGLSEPR